MVLKKIAKYWIILLLFLTSCGKFKTVEIQDEFLPYYNQFIEEGLIRGKNVQTDNLIIKFGKLEKHKLGQCTGYKSNLSFGIRTPTIIVNRESWPNLTELDRTTLIIHELGHCVLNKDHDDSTNLYGMPLSIMNTYAISIFAPEYTAEHWSELMDRLFR